MAIRGVSALGAAQVAAMTCGGSIKIDFPVSGWRRSGRFTSALLPWVNHEVDEATTRWTMQATRRAGSKAIRKADKRSSQKCGRGKQPTRRATQPMRRATRPTRQATQTRQTDQVRQTQKFPAERWKIRQHSGNEFSVPMARLEPGTQEREVRKRSRRYRLETFVDRAARLSVAYPSTVVSIEVLGPLAPAIRNRRENAKGM
ncbi:hypothetical protein BV22DRAFT_1051893 [Leucogyrophana mollusca]|uniref:Uncharacterized protein n=1 Tax=Leucogyrophana mollusca TaxID=85980 RepID=A0ACB8AXD0_9AGAM|nr:hypothetical protein BV22DRAFT_1051893 [Leucogyrophana mollusca]